MSNKEWTPASIEGLNYWIKAAPDNKIEVLVGDPKSMKYVGFDPEIIIVDKRARTKAVKLGIKIVSPIGDK